jgi:hypothetical protein
MVATSSKTTNDRPSENVMKAGFAQPGSNGNRKNIECFRYGKKEHMARYCHEIISNQSNANYDSATNNEEGTKDKIKSSKKKEAA